QTGGERIGAHAIYWRFAGRIDIGDGHDIGIVEAGGKVFEEIAQARVAVRLDDGENAACGHLARGGEHGGDFDRVMAVIVDNADFVPVAGGGEAALHAGELLQAVADARVGDTKFARDSDGGDGVLDIVA